jgi:hypothetical protein
MLTKKIEEMIDNLDEQINMSNDINDSNNRFNNKLY